MGMGHSLTTNENPILTQNTNNEVIFKDDNINLSNSKDIINENENDTEKINFQERKIFDIIKKITENNESDNDEQNNDDKIPGTMY